MCSTTRGVTVTAPMAKAVCLCGWSTNQNKAFGGRQRGGGAQFSCGAASLGCPAHPGTFLITIQSLSVYTISGAEWTVAQGSPWEALHAPPCLQSSPSLALCPRCLPQQPHPTPAHKHTQSHRAASSLPHMHINWSHGRECVTTPRFLSFADTEGFWGRIAPLLGLH